MKPETLAFLSAADQDLADATAILAIHLPRQAARLAYYAEFHAAQALIFERTGRIPKTHRGVDKEFHKLAKHEPNLPATLPADLSSSYRFKELADYDVASATPITEPEAAAALTSARHFIAAVGRALGPSPAP